MLIERFARYIPFVRALVIERDHYKDIAEQGLMPSLKRMEIEGGRMDAEWSGEVVRAMSLAFCSHFRDSGAPNYLQMTIHEQVEPFGTFTVTVQKHGGETPAQQLKAARNTIAQLEDELNRLRGIDVSPGIN